MKKTNRTGAAVACACGCGQPADKGAKWKWGHKPKNGEAATAGVIQRLEEANKGKLSERPRRLLHATNGNGNGHRAAFATVRLSEAHIDRFLTALPLEHKAALVTQYLERM